MNEHTPPSTGNLKGQRRHFYVLRLWRPEGRQGSDWQASLENPETGQRIGFAGLEELFCYLIDQCESTDHTQEAAKEK